MSKTSLEKKVADIVNRSTPIGFKGPKPKFEEEDGYLDVVWTGDGQLLTMTVYDDLWVEYEFNVDGNVGQGSMKISDTLPGYFIAIANAI